MLEYRIGDIAISKAGHDKTSYYVVVNIDKDFIYLVDGKYRKIDNPKKKNIKHIQIKNMNEDVIKDKILSGKISNEEIKYFLKTFGGKNV